MKPKQDELKTINLRNYFKSLANIWTYRMRIVITLLLISFSTQVMADALNGRMSCKIKSNNVIGIDEGIPKQYTGFKDQFIVGDTIILEYGLFNDGQNVRLEIRDLIRNIGHFFIHIDSNFKGSEMWSISNLGKGFTYAGEKIFFSSDLIKGVNHPYAKNNVVSSNLLLRRYYKNDWQGIVSNQTNLLEYQIYTIDCRHETDVLDEILNRLSKTSQPKN